MSEEVEERPRVHQGRRQGRCATRVAAAHTHGARTTTHTHHGIRTRRRRGPDPCRSPLQFEGPNRANRPRQGSHSSSRVRCCHSCSYSADVVRSSDTWDGDSSSILDTPLPTRRCRLPWGSDTSLSSFRQTLAGFPRSAKVTRTVRRDRHPYTLWKKGGEVLKPRSPDAIPQSEFLGSRENSRYQQ